MNPWELPVKATVGGIEYPIRTDYRDILGIFRHLNDPNEPEPIRWYIAVKLFFEGTIPKEHLREAMDYMVDFITCCDPKDRPGPKVLDWEQDSRFILAEVNRAAGTEIRSLPYLHWWTFLSYFHAIGEGQLSTLISIRTKLQNGKKLEPWEQDYYRKNRHLVDLRPRYTPEEMAQQLKLNQLLDP